MENGVLESLYLGIVCPVGNEKDTIERFTVEMLDECRAVKKVTFFAVFDNVCKDGSMTVLSRLADEDPRIRVVWAPENQCVVDAYIRGYREAVGSACDWILEVDAGYSHQPSDLKNFFKHLSGGSFDCIFGSRFCRGGTMTEASLKRYLLSRGGTILANILLGTALRDMTSGYQFFSRKALEEVLQKGIRSKGHFFQTEIKAHCRYMNIIEVPIHYRAPSSNPNIGILFDAFFNLFRLFALRLAGIS